MRNTDHRRKVRSDALAASPQTPAGYALLLAALMIDLAAVLMIAHPALAFARDAQESQEGGRAGNAGSSDGGGSGNSLGVIIDIPDGWPLNDKGGDHDIVRFKKCFPFCDVERPDGGPSQDSTVIEGEGEQTIVIEQTQITQETQTDEGGTDGGGTDDGNGDGTGGGNDEDQPDEPTTSEETTVLQETTISEGIPAPPGETAKCPTGPSGPISEVTLTQVLDADTLQVEGSDGNAYTIRLIGAEAPDLAGAGAEGGQNEPGAEEAAAFARETLGGRGQNLELEYDEQKTDENGQTFAYVWMQRGPESPKPGTIQELLDRPATAGPVLYNRLLVEDGFARAATDGPNTDYAECLKQAEDAARTDAAGPWKGQAFSPTPSGAAAGAASKGETAAAVSVGLVSRKTPPSESRNEANAKDAETPPITGHAKVPEPQKDREADPGIAIGLVFIAFLAGAAVLARAVARTGEPAGIGPPEGRT